MRTIPPFVAYPLFRLTVWLATGIFLFDSIASDRLPWTSVAMAFVVSVLILCCFYRTFKYKYRALFGVCGCLSFVLLGGTLVLKEREAVYYPWDGRKQVYYGVVETVPSPKGKTLRAEVRVASVFNPADTLGGRVVNRSVLLYWMPDSLAPALRCGDSVCFYARISRPDFKEARFDYAEYLMRKGISGTAMAFAGDWQRLPNRSGLTFRQKAAGVQRQITDMYRRWGLKDETLAVVSALTVGETDGLTPEIKAVYNATGASHVLSLSGLHVGILAGMLMCLFYPFSRFPVGKKLVSCLIVVALWGFAVMSGLSPSVVRAVAMFSLFIFASLVTSERFSGFLTLTLTAFLMLLYQPFYLFDVSFQLSFVAVLAILCFYPVFSGWCPLRSKPFRYVWNLLSLSLAAQLGTLPFVLHYFGTFPTYFLLANLLVSPLSVCILGCALGAILLSVVFPFGGMWAVKALQFSTVALNDSMAWIQQLAGSQITSFYISAFQSLALCACMAFFYAYWYNRKASCLVGALVALNAFAAGNVFA